MNPSDQKSKDIPGRGMSGHKDHNTYGTAKEIELLSA
jgi:hypothetical protein